MKLVLRGLAAVVLACSTFACAAPTEEPAEGPYQEDRVLVDPVKEAAGEPTIHPQNMPVPCNDAQSSFASWDAIFKHGPYAAVTGCNYNSSTGYVVYTYDYFYMAT